MTGELPRSVLTAASVRGQVAELLREAIVTGRFSPGQRLIERDLCELTGVSRPSVREALRQLESDGLVKLLPHKGPVVAQLSRDEVANIYQVRGAIEALAAKNFARSASDGMIARLRETVVLLRAAFASQDVEKSLVAKQAFYDVLLDGSGNPLVRSILRTLNDRINILRRISLSSPNRGNASLAEIDLILTAIEARDEAAAHAATLHHIENACESALDTFA